jgi:hypothetical protein
MVRDEAQMYTIEGFAAVLIMLVTAYLILGTSQVYTPADSHITEMQLEQLGNDALVMMDTPANGSSMSPLQEMLQEMIAANAKPAFGTMFLSYLNQNTGATHQINDLHYNATVYYRYVVGGRDMLGSYNFGDSSTLNPNVNGDLLPGDTAVKVSKWVRIDQRISGVLQSRNAEQLVLMEVLIWRG